MRAKNLPKGHQKNAPDAALTNCSILQQSEWPRTAVVHQTEIIIVRHTRKVGLKLIPSGQKLYFHFQIIFLFTSVLVICHLSVCFVLLSFHEWCLGKGGSQEPEIRSTTSVAGSSTNVNYIGNLHWKGTSMLSLWSHYGQIDEIVVQFTSLKDFQRSQILIVKKSPFKSGELGKCWFESCSCRCLPSRLAF